MNDSQLKIKLRSPSSNDGAAVFRLISQCPPLDTNSLYCNLLQCAHFTETSVVAECDDEVVGFTSGYLMPERPGTLFIWQVAVDEKIRGQGLASRMVTFILSRSKCCQVTYLETTITESNRASWALFTSLAGKLRSQINTSSMFDRDLHFDGEHESEILARIGPFNRVLITNHTRGSHENF